MIRLTGEIGRESGEGRRQEPESRVFRPSALRFSFARLPGVKAGGVLTRRARIVLPLKADAAEPSVWVNLNSHQVVGA